MVLSQYTRIKGHPIYTPRAVAGQSIDGVHRRPEHQVYTVVRDEQPADVQGEKRGEPGLWAGTAHAVAVHVDDITGHSYRGCGLVRTVTLLLRE